MTNNPLIPMGAITGKPSKAFLTETLENYRRAGIVQYLIYPRSGCEMEYLSEEWFDVCGHILSECKRLEYSSVWLYDEFNWPSGKCNGEVMKDHPEYCLHYLVFRQKNGKICKELRCGEKFPDVLNPHAAKHFIELTHEKYAQRFGKYFGTLIKGFFTDEPSAGYHNINPVTPEEYMIPWYKELEDDYEKLTGHTLVSDVELSWMSGVNSWEPICRQLQEKRFITGFIAPVRNWCREHGLELTGHLLAEHYALASIFHNGHPLPVLSSFTLPGIDLIYTGQKIAGIEPLTLATGQYAIDRTGNKGGLAELFALGPCDLSIERQRRQIWLCALCGIDHYVLAVAALDARGNIEKSAYYNPYSRTQPWFELYPELGKEAAFAASFAGKERAYTVGVRYPYYPVQLHDLLEQLIQAQINAALLMPEETSDVPFILNITPDGRFREERSNAVFYSAEAIIAYLAEQKAQQVIFREKNGSAARDLFVRCFKDGSVAALDFANTRRELFCERNGQKFPCTIEGSGVLLLPGWEMSCSAPNTARITLKENRYEFTLTAPINDLKLAVRHYRQRPELLLDGSPIAASQICSSLPPGFNELFVTTEELSLAPGKHIIECLAHDEDYPFMPAAFLTGCFDETEKGVFSPGDPLHRSTTGLSGVLVQKGKIHIPIDAQGFVIDTEKLGTEVKINGISLGKRLWEPFYWQLPHGSAGTEVDIEIIRYTSCAPIFTDDEIDNGKCSFPRIKQYCEICWKLQK